MTPQEETDEEVLDELRARVERSRRHGHAAPEDVAGEPPAPRPGRRRWPLVTAALVALVVVAAAALAAANNSPGSAGSTTAGPKGTNRSPGGTTTTVPGNPAGVPADFATFHDDKFGLGIRYPKAWTKVDSGQADVPLLLSVGGYDSVQVRAFAPLSAPATVDTLANLKKVTDGVVYVPGHTVLQQRPLTVPNGMFAYYYLYTFKDETTGQEGVHAHYFFFLGQKWASLVFQAIPSDGFRPLAATFDQVAASFTLDPAPAPPAGSTSTTAAGAPPAAPASSAPPGSTAKP